MKASIVKPMITEEEFFSQNCTSSKKATMYGIKFGPISKPIFKLDMCVIKYPLGRFDKITVEHEHGEFMENLNKCIMNALGAEASKFVKIKDLELGLKITELTREKAEKLEKFDVVDVLAEFNNCWYMGGKIYTSFVLKDVKESDAELNVPKETPFLFSDIE